MYDDFSDEIGVFDFDHLLDQGLQASPSQLHGCLTGMLSAGSPPEPEYGLDALAQTLNLDLHGELAIRAMQLYSVTAEALQDEEFTFNPLLPDDDEELVSRTAALASWCEGFLAGFAYRLAVEEATAEAGPEETEDEAEDSFSELVEYLRVAVVNIFMDNSASVRTEALAPETPRRLH